MLYTWVRSRRHVEQGMPWKVSGVVERRKQFLAEYQSGQWTMTDLCRAYGISRPTGYAVLRRYEQDGEPGLEEQSRAHNGIPTRRRPRSKRRCCDCGGSMRAGGRGRCGRSCKTYTPRYAGQRPAPWGRCWSAKG